MTLRPDFRYVVKSSLTATPLALFSRRAMPLRSKIMNPAFNQSMASSRTTTTAVAAAPPETDPKDDVLFGSTYGLRTIELNRPEKLNALNSSMVNKIAPRLQEWEKSQLAQIVIVKGSGPRAFCAGGDVATLAKDNQSGPEGIQRSVDFFAREYRLNHLIATYDKPYVAFMDGVTMGGGVGLSVHAPFRIATERTLFAMPETTIGLFPDVGGSFFLPRLDGEIGTYLALTSERLTGVHALYAGIATHYIHSSSLPDVESRLSELTFADNLPLQSRNKIVDATLEEFSTGLPPTPPLLSGPLRSAIDRCFSLSSIPSILAALEREAPTTGWPAKTIAALRARSPTSLAVTLQQLRRGRLWTIATAFQREHLLATRFMNHPDFVAGVTALLLNKPATKPVWTPRTIEDCPADAADPFFALREGAEHRLRLLKKGADDYARYPHEAFGLPSEAAVRELVLARDVVLSRAELVQWFVDRYAGKEGVREKVQDVVERCVESDGSGRLVWMGRQKEEEEGVEGVYGAVTV